MTKGLALAVLWSALAADQPLELGKPVPEFSVKTLDGRVFKLAELKEQGKILALVSWSPECGSGSPCIPRATAIAKKFADSPKVQYVAVCSYGETAEDLKAYVKEHSIAYPVCHDEGSKFARHFSAEQVNSAYVLKDGKLFWRGGIDKDGKDDFALAIEAALAGKDAPPSDRPFAG